MLMSGPAVESKQHDGKEAQVATSVATSFSSAWAAGVDNAWCCLEISGQSTWWM